MLRLCWASLSERLLVVHSSVSAFTNVGLRKSLVDRWPTGRLAIVTLVTRVSRASFAARLPVASFLASYLVDPASSHMLVSKIKPCMSKYKPQQGETANGSLNHT